MKLVVFSLLLALAAGLVGCGLLFKSPGANAGGCPLPPKVDQEWVRVFCEQHGDVNGCGYVGTIDDKVCLSIVESTKCGPWTLTARSCDVHFLVSTDEGSSL